MCISESGDSETRSKDSDWSCPYIYSASIFINEFKLLLDNLFLLIDNKCCLQFSLLDKRVFYGTIWHSLGGCTMAYIFCNVSCLALPVIFGLGAEAPYRDGSLRGQGRGRPKKCLHTKRKWQDRVWKQRWIIWTRPMAMFLCSWECFLGYNGFSGSATVPQFWSCLDIVTQSQLGYLWLGKSQKVTEELNPAVKN